MPFYDLSVRFTSPASIPLGLAICRDMGYSGIALEIPKNVDSRAIPKFEGLAVWARTTIVPATQGTEALKQRLAPLRPTRDIVALRCTNPLITKWAANDHRIDILSFSQDIRKLFDESTAKAIASSDTPKAIEIEIAPLITASPGRRMSILRAFRHAAALAGRKHCPLVLVSGATNPYGLRGPRDMASLANLFGMDYSRALDALSFAPKTIIERNLEKREGLIVTPGVRIIPNAKQVEEDSED
jgi:RNase P/RNase MRP subunit p30